MGYNFPKRINPAGLIILANSEKKTSEENFTQAFPCKIDEKQRQREYL